jgi:large subunit ribosomal protein L22
MESIARLRYLQASPQKVRLVADLIRGRGVEEASTLLQLSTKAAARPLSKLLRSAIANAENRAENQQRGVDVGQLYVKEIFVDGGPTLKRLRSQAMGRAFRILKRQSHVTIKLDSRSQSAEPT